MRREEDTKFIRLYEKGKEKMKEGKYSEALELLSKA